MNTTRPRVRHLAFYEMLESTHPATEMWRAGTACLHTIRLVDAWRRNPRRRSRISARQLRAVTARVNDLGGTIHSQLMRVVHAIESNRSDAENAVAAALRERAWALHLEMHWQLAIDICKTIVERLGASIDHASLLAVVTQWASAARASGRLDESERVYLELGRLASRFRNIEYGFRSRIGLANVHLEHGNYPEAQARIDEVIAEMRAAGDASLNGILSRAIHTRAAVAMCRTRYAEGVELAREALDLCDDAVERDMILHDIASALLSIGHLSTARDALLLIRRSARNHSTRWSACVNLMEIAGLEGRTKAFEYWRHKLADQRMRPWHHGHFFRLAGEGYERLGRYDEALEMYQAAVSIGEAFGVNDVIIMAEMRANELRARRYLTRPASEPSVAADLQEVISVVSELRVAAGIPAGAEDP